MFVNSGRAFPASDPPGPLTPTLGLTRAAFGPGVLSAALSQAEAADAAVPERDEPYDRH